jgi:hypothetical protein
VTELKKFIIARPSRMIFSFSALASLHAKLHFSLSNEWLIA